jgi:hypothetical protein
MMTRRLDRRCLFLWLWLTTTTTDVSTTPTPTPTLKVGDVYCIEGYVMDRYCIDNIHLLDNPSEESLKRPEYVTKVVERLKICGKMIILICVSRPFLYVTSFDSLTLSFHTTLSSLHSVHCLVDVGICRESPFEILTPPPTGSDTYGIGWRLMEDDNNNDDNGMSSKDKIVHLARKVGDPDSWCSTCFGGGLEQTGFRATIKARVESLGRGITPPIVSVMGAYSSSVVNPDTLQSTLVNDNPCQYFFAMNEFGVAHDEIPPKPTLSPTVRMVTSVPTMRINTLTTEWPSTILPPNSQSYSTPSKIPSSAPIVASDDDESRTSPSPGILASVPSLSPALATTYPPTVNTDTVSETVNFIADSAAEAATASLMTTTLRVMVTSMVAARVATTMAVLS